MHYRLGVIVVMLSLVACGGGGGDKASGPPRFTNPQEVGAEAVVTPPVASAERWVTSAADAGPGTLRQALADAVDGDRIAMHASLAGARVALNSTLNVADDVIIDASPAPGFTLDGRGAVRIVAMPHNTAATYIGVGFHGGRISNGSTAPGGAINTGNDCTLTIRDCTFTANVADIGGAVRAGYGTELLVEDSTFSGNDGSNADNGFSAGAISTNGHGAMILRRCRFVGNRGHNGGAVYNLLQPVDIEDCVFIGNHAEGPGGAVFTDEGNWVGPGATVGGHLRIRRCWIEGNSSTELGGGLFLWANVLDEVLVEDTVLLWNRVDRDGSGSAKGGGLRTRGIVTLRRVAFIENTAAQQGGGVWLDGPGPFTLSDCVFSGNVASGDAGGGATFNGSGTHVLRHCTFAGNYAGRACGAFWFGSAGLDITLFNSVVADNLAGQDHAQDQIGYQPQDGGGNVEWPAPKGSGRRVAAGGVLADPLLGEATQFDNTIIVPLTNGSPAVGEAMPSEATAEDIRGHARDSDPDSGAVEATVEELTLTVATANG